MLYHEQDEGGSIPRVPVVEGDWWRICRMPELGELAGPDPARQHVVDHGFIQAADGRWQLWACIRGTAVGRIIYGWEGDSLEDGPWPARGIKVRADARYGEQVEPEEKVGAPFFLKAEDTYYCFYHSSGVHVMTSQNGVDYRRKLDAGGASRMLRDGGRDVMVLKSGETHFLYLCVTTVSADRWARSFIITRTSQDLERWSDYTIVSEGGRAGNGPVSSESPFVVELDGFYYLFRATSTDFNTYVYRSRNPYDFGVNDDSKLIAVLPIKAPEIVLHGGQYYISDLSDFRGIKLARLRWQEAPG